MKVRIEQHIAKDGSVTWAVCDAASEAELELAVSVLEKRQHRGREKSHGADETADARKGPGRPALPGRSRDQGRAEKRWRDAIGLLRTIIAAGADGATSDALTTAFGMSAGNQGLGYKLSKLGEFIKKEIGIPLESLYSVRGEGDAKRWAPGQDIQRAIKALEEKQAASGET